MRFVIIDTCEIITNHTCEIIDFTSSGIIDKYTILYNKLHFMMAYLRTTKS